mmetsp:Transcript_108475/g.215401  ORF Transcript_108475/g.215401 Transcript_108475/m.215401 type:complete len:108 (-) Transcript_108475:829-1152(-)
MVCSIEVFLTVPRVEPKVNDEYREVDFYPKGAVKDIASAFIADREGPDIGFHFTIDLGGPDVVIVLGVLIHGLEVHCERAYQMDNENNLKNCWDDHAGPDEPHRPIQ